MDSLSSQFTQLMCARTIENCRDIEELRKITQLLWKSNAYLKSMAGQLMLQNMFKQPLTTPEHLGVVCPGDEQSERHG